MDWLDDPRLQGGPDGDGDLLWLLLFVAVICAAIVLFL